MKQIKNSMNQDVRHFVTDSGLNVYIVHRPGFKRSAAVYGTPFGALNLTQKLDNELINHKSGVAHFLEHKLFEDDSKDVLSQFSDMGANGNAFTSYDQTMYYFGFNGPIEEPLRLLIDFVSKFSVSAESVEKEKGIIVEEIKMYEQMPHMRLFNETYKNVFHNYPYIYDIAGTPESVQATTLEDLRQAYEANYDDSRMVLSIVTPEDPQTIHDMVIEATKYHEGFKVKVEDVFEDEPESVVHEYREIEDNVETNKMSLSYKIPFVSTHKQNDEFMINMLLELNFSELNPDFESWRDEGIVSHSFGFGIELRETFVLISFLNEGDKHDAFRDTIDTKMRNLEVIPSDFEQLQKRYFGEAIMSFGSVDDLAIIVARAHFDGQDYFTYLEMIRDLKPEALIDINEKIVIHKPSFLLMKKKA